MVFIFSWAHKNTPLTTSGLHVLPPRIEPYFQCMFFPLNLVISIKSEVPWKHFLVFLLMETYCFTISPSVFPHNFSVFINCRQWVSLEISAELESMINRSVPSLLPFILTVVVYVLLEFAFWSADRIAHNTIFTGAFQILLHSLLDCSFFVSLLGLFCFVS